MTTRKKQQKKKKTNKGVRRGQQPTPDDDDEWNFLQEAGPGCHIARCEEDRRRQWQRQQQQQDEEEDDWVIEWESVDPEDYVDDGDDEDDDIPDIAVDTEERTLSLCNIRRRASVVAYITVYGRRLRNKRGELLRQGSTTDQDGVTEPCTTLVVLCPPCTFAHLCYIDVVADEDDGDGDDNDGSSSPSSSLLENTRIDSDVQEWSRHSNPSDCLGEQMTFGFPLRGGPFLCTQGEGGRLTHFFGGNLHAVDFRCPTGTPLLAVADGVVAESNDENRLTGIAVSNLFKWNSIMLKLDSAAATTDGCDVGEGDGSNAGVGTTPTPSATRGTNSDVYVEYVHISESLVRKGDRVREGQVIGYSGSVGFSPEPHLHLAAYRSDAPTAETVRFEFHTSARAAANSSRDAKTIIYQPRAGKWYDETGEVGSPLAKNST